MNKTLRRIFLVGSFKAVNFLMNRRLVPRGARMKLQGLYGRLGSQLWSTMPLRR